MANDHQPWEPLYYLTHDGIDGDVEFYRDFTGTDKTVLELGCGHGRLTHGFLALGHRVTALDQSAYALDTLKAHVSEREPAAALTCLRCDFADFPNADTYDRIVLSFNGLLCLPDAEKLHLFEKVSDHLAKDGLFLFDMYDGADFVDSSTPDDEWVYDPQLIKTVHLGQSVFDVYESGQFRSGDGRLEMNYHYFPEDQDELDEKLAYTIVHYPLSEAKLRRLMGQANLKIRQIITMDQHDNSHLFVVACS